MFVIKVVIQSYFKFKVLYINLMVTAKQNSVVDAYSLENDSKKITTQKQRKPEKVSGKGRKDLKIRKKITNGNKR